MILVDSAGMPVPMPVGVFVFVEGIERFAVFRSLPYSRCESSLRTRERRLARGLVACDARPLQPYVIQMKAIRVLIMGAARAQHAGPNMDARRMLHTA